MSNEQRETLQNLYDAGYAEGYAEGRRQAAAGAAGAARNMGVAIKEEETQSAEGKGTSYDDGYAEGRRQATARIRELNRIVAERTTERDEAKVALAHQIAASGKTIGRLGGEISKIEDKLRGAVRWNIPSSGADQRTVEQLVDEVISDRDKDTECLHDRTKQLDAIRATVRAAGDESTLDAIDRQVSSRAVLEVERQLIAHRDRLVVDLAELGRRYDDMVTRIAAALAVAASVSGDPKAADRG